MADPIVLRAADVLDAFGVDTHIPYTDGLYANLTDVAADLNYLGIADVRDSISDGVGGSAPLSSFIQLARHGTRFTFSVGGGTTASLQATIDLIKQLNGAVPGSVVAVEGANEINNWPVTYNGVTGLQGALDLQQAIYADVHGDPALAGVAVDYFTGYAAGTVAVGPDPSATAGLADFDTQHPYPNHGEAPQGWVDPAFALGNEGSKGPFVYTETGYSTVGSGDGVVDDDVQAKYSLDLLLDATEDGSSHTFLYQLLDAYAPGSPQGDDGFGLFTTDNSPKPVATAIHNLTSILADSGQAATTFAPTRLDYSIVGLPSSGRTFEIAKSTGIVDIVVWSEPPIWNASTRTEITAPTVTVTVALSNAFSTVSVYDPMIGSTPLETLTNVDSVQLGVTDHPLIIEVGPIVAPAPVASPDPAPVSPIANTAAPVVLIAPQVTASVDPPVAVNPPATAAAPASAATATAPSATAAVPAVAPQATTSPPVQAPSASLSIADDQATPPATSPQPVPIAPAAATADDQAPPTAPATAAPAPIDGGTAALPQPQPTIAVAAPASSLDGATLIDLGGVVILGLQSLNGTGPALVDLARGTISRGDQVAVTLDNIQGVQLGADPSTVLGLTSGVDLIYGDTGPALFRGEGATDIVQGGTGDTILIGGAGNEIFYGNGGNDMMSGGTAANFLRAGPTSASTDVFYGSGGADFISGGPGATDVIGGSGTEDLTGGAGFNQLVGSNQSASALNILNGGTGMDVFYAGAGTNLLNEGSGTDVLAGNTGTDDIYGGSGRSFIYGGSGTDVITTGLGNQYVQAGSGLTYFNDTEAGLHAGRFDQIENFSGGRGTNLYLPAADQAATSFVSQDGGTAVLTTLEGGMAEIFASNTSVADVQAHTHFTL